LKKVLFDTSVLVPALWSPHVNFSKAFTLLDRAITADIEGFISQHALLETYATLTGMPVRPPLSPSEVNDVLTTLMKSVQVVALDESDYRDVMSFARDHGVRGGAAYDILHVRAALKCKADSLATFNLKHFERLTTGVPLSVFEP